MCKKTSFYTITTQNIVSLLFFVVIATPFIFLNLKPGDDYYFRSALENTDWISFGSMFYNTWSGRYFFNYIFPSLITDDLIIFLRCIYLLTSAIFVSSAIKIVEYYAGKVLSNTQKTIFYLSFFAFNLKSLGAAVFWITGAFNFFLPFTLYLYIYSILLTNINNTLKLYQKSICFLFLIAVCSFEQTAILLIITFIFFLAYFKLKNKIFFLYLLFVSFLCTSVLFLAEGNYVRYISEMNTWYPLFHSIPVYKKVFDVIQLSFESIILRSFRFFILFCISLYFIMKEYTLISVFNKTLMICAFLLISAIYLCFIDGLSLHYTYGSKVDIENILYQGFIFQQITSVLVSTVIMCILLYFIYCILINTNTFVPLLFFVLAGSSTFCMIAFSPTIYASEERTHFIMNMSIWILYGVLISKIQNIYHLRILCGVIILAGASQLHIVFDKFEKYFL